MGLWRARWRRACWRWWWRGAAAGCSSASADVGDQPPSVALTSAVAEAPAGTLVRLAAAASDDFGIDSVAFYREEAAGPPTLLATDVRPPYQLDTALPAGASGTVWRYYARAFDGAGQHGDSAVVEITVR